MFSPSCIRAKFRADDGYELNLTRAGAHFNEPPTGQGRFTSRRNIDRWKIKNGVTDTISVARVLLCPEELKGQTDCCGQSIGVVGSAVFSGIGNSDEPFRVFLRPEDNPDDLCTTRDSDNTTVCDVMISCPPCEAVQCRGPGGVCVELVAFECPIGEEPFIREDEFCACLPSTATPSPTPTNSPVKLTCTSHNVFLYSSVVPIGRKFLQIQISPGPQADGICDYLIGTLRSGGGPCDQPVDLAGTVVSRRCEFTNVSSLPGFPNCSETEFLSSTCPAMFVTREPVMSVAVFWICHEEGGDPGETLLVTCASEYPDGQNDCRLEGGADCNCPVTIPAPVTLPATDS
mmetsp:Transcript_39725/g.158054  ORF Transcript_39725/g.158054 Transcript_39725/m.158054 type:complete len:345 (-) Transcript_39725:169-1203(-)